MPPAEHKSEATGILSESSVLKEVARPGHVKEPISTAFDLPPYRALWIPHRVDNHVETII